MQSAMLCAMLYVMPGAAFHSDFETNQETWSWYTHTVDGGGVRIGRLSEALARRGRRSAQFVMDRSQGGLFHRAMFRKTDGFSTDRDERWIGFSTFFPASGPDAWVKDRLPELVFQLHNDPDASPILGLYIEDGLLSIQYRWSGINPASNADVATRIIPVGSQEPGRWVDWIFHVKPSPTDSSGLLEAWMTGPDGNYRMVADRKRIQFGFNNGSAPAIDIGLYKWPWKDSTYNGMVSEVDRRVVHFDEFRLAGPDGSFAQVAVPQASAVRFAPRRSREAIEGGREWFRNGRPMDALGRRGIRRPEQP